MRYEYCEFLYDSTHDLNERAKEGWVFERMIQRPMSDGTRYTARHFAIMSREVEEPGDDQPVWANARTITVTLATIAALLVLLILATIAEAEPPDLVMRPMIQHWSEPQQQWQRSYPATPPGWRGL